MRMRAEPRSNEHARRACAEKSRCAEPAQTGAYARIQRRDEHMRGARAGTSIPAELAQRLLLHLQTGEHVLGGRVHGSRELALARRGGVGVALVRARGSRHTPPPRAEMGGRQGRLASKTQTRQCGARHAAVFEKQCQCLDLDSDAVCVCQLVWMR